MRLMIINSLYQTEIIESDILPRIDDRIDIFKISFGHYPVVINILLFPRDPALKELNIDAVVTVK